MAIAYGSHGVQTFSAALSVTLAQTPATPAKGVIVFIVQNATAVNACTGVTYGGVAMTQVTGSPIINSTGETCVLSCYFLGKGIPTGSANVTATFSSARTGRLLFSYCTATKAETAIEALDTTSFNSTSLANPSATLVTGVGVETYTVIGIHSGQDAAAGITPLAGWTQMTETDMGAQMAAQYRKNPNSTGGNITVGWTQTAEDAYAIAIALKEIDATTAIKDFIGGSGFIPFPR